MFVVYPLSKKQTQSTHKYVKKDEGESRAFSGVFKEREAAVVHISINQTYIQQQSTLL